MVIPMKDSGAMILKKDKVYINTSFLVRNMKEDFQKGRNMEWENLFSPQVMFIKENSQMDTNKEKELFNFKVVRHLKGIGKKIKLKEMVS